MSYLRRVIAKQLRIKKSDIHGLGVFANEFVAKEDRISAMRLAKIDHMDTFSSLPNTGVVINGDVHAVMEGFPLWYVNYSDTPNIEVLGDVVYATRSIAKDDELTLRNPDETPNN